MFDRAFGSKQTLVLATLILCYSLFNSPTLSLVITAFDHNLVTLCMQCLRACMCAALSHNGPIATGLNILHFKEDRKEEKALQDTKHDKEIKNCREKNNIHNHTQNTIGNY